MGTFKKNTGRLLDWCQSIIFSIDLELLHLIIISANVDHFSVIFVSAGFE